MIFPSQIFTTQIFPFEVFPRVSSYIESLNDSLSLTQSVSARHIFNKSLSNFVIFAHSLNISDGITLSNSITFTDSLNSFVRHISILTDTLTFSDSLSHLNTHILNLLDTLHFIDQVTDGWERTLVQTLILTDHLNANVIYTEIINQSLFLSDSISPNNQYIKSLNDVLSFTQVVHSSKIVSQLLINILTFSDNQVDSLRHLININDTLNITQNISIINKYSRHILNTLLFNQSLSNDILQNHSLIDHLSFSQIVSLLLINQDNITILNHGIIGGGLDVKSESKNCHEVSLECHAEGLETISGLSFPCSIINGQMALIPNYINGDFKIGDTVGFYNLNGGTNKSTEEKVNVNTVSIIDGTNTLITFSNIFTNHITGFISLMIDWASHSEGSKTVASGKYSHAGGFGAISELPTKFARSDNTFAQYSIISLGTFTTDTTLTPLKINNNVDFSIRNNKTYTFLIHIGARNVDGSDHAYFIRQGIIHNENGSLAFVGSIGTIGTDINGSDWSISITATNTLNILVVGETDKTIKWFAKVECLEL